MVSVTKQQDPAERLTKEAVRLPRANKSVEANVNRRRTDDDADIDNAGLSDDMEVATVSVAPDPGDIDEEGSISIDEPIDEEPEVTTRSGRKVKVTTRMKEVSIRGQGSGCHRLHMPYDHQRSLKKTKSTSYSGIESMTYKIGPLTPSLSPQRVIRTRCIGTKPCRSPIRRNF
jgi:hypothetical protein